MAKRSRTAAERAEQLSRLRTRPARARMLAAARELATARGYESIKAGDIAQAAGVSRETFYTHFADKRSCLAEATGPRMGEIESELRIASEEQQSWAAPLMQALEAALQERYGSQRSPRGRIIEAMLALVAKHGYCSVRLADVIKRAKVSYPSFYRHFASKEECFATACESLVAELNERLNENLAEDADQAARLIALAELFAVDPATARVLAIEAEQLPRRGDELQHSACLYELVHAANGSAPVDRNHVGGRGGLLDRDLGASSHYLAAGAFVELLRNAVLTDALSSFPADVGAVSTGVLSQRDGGERIVAHASRRARAARQRDRTRDRSRRRSSASRAELPS